MDPPLVQRKRSLPSYSPLGYLCSSLSLPSLLQCSITEEPESPGTVDPNSIVTGTSGGFTIPRAKDFITIDTTAEDTRGRGP